MASLQGAAVAAEMPYNVVSSRKTAHFKSVLSIKKTFEHGKVAVLLINLTSIKLYTWTTL